MRNLQVLAGAEGFEPPDARTKTWCLTTWLRPNKQIDFNLKRYLKQPPLAAWTSGKYSGKVALKARH